MAYGRNFDNIIESKRVFLQIRILIHTLAPLIEKGRGTRPNEALATCHLTRCYILPKGKDKLASRIYDSLLLANDLSKLI